MSAGPMEDSEEDPFALPGLSWMLLCDTDAAIGNVKEGWVLNLFIEFYCFLILICAIESKINLRQTEAPSVASSPEMALYLLTLLHFQKET